VGRKGWREGGRDRQWMGVDQGEKVVLMVIERHLCGRKRIGGKEGRLLAVMASSWCDLWSWVLAGELRGGVRAAIGEERRRGVERGEDAKRKKSKGLAGPTSPVSPLFHA